MLWKKKTISIYYISILYVADGLVQLDYNNKTIDNFLT